MSDHDHRNNPDYKLGGRTGKGFMPGQSGNPAGRPKKPTLKETIERILDEELPGKGMTKLEAVAHIWINEALVKRNPRALNALINRLYPVPRLRPVDAEYPATPVFETKIIEFVTHRDGPGEDYYREVSQAEMSDVITRSDPYPTLDHLRGDDDDDQHPPEDEQSPPYDTDTT